MKVQLKKYITESSLGKIAKRYYALINGTKEEPKYLHTEILSEEESLDMTFESISGNYTKVTADVVSFDSPTPLKKRSVVSRAKGDIPKISTGRSLNEKQMNLLIILMQLKGKFAKFMQELFRDVKDVITGNKETIEEMTYSALSSGVAIIRSETNVGHGVRYDFNVPNSNKFGSIWSDVNSKPLDDISKILKKAKAKGTYLKVMWTDSHVLDKLLENNQVKAQFAFSKGIVGADVPDLEEDQLNALLKKKFKLKLRVEDRVFVHEKDGKQSEKDGWTENMVVFTPREKVGTLVYGKLAEHTIRTEGVAYSEPNKYILVSMFGSTNPVSKVTKAECLAIPVLQNVDQFYYLDTNEGQEVAPGEIEEDANINIWETSLLKATVIEKYNAIADDQVQSDITDADLIKAINTLSDEEEDFLKEELGVS